jgi:formate hydrogenlyase subunit 3/multisubunit Na+/H+ antiporter MnhD subunit
MEPPLVILVVVVVAALLVARTLVRRRARAKADRESQVPAMPMVIAAALLGAAFLAIGITILVTSPDLSQGSGTGRYGWMPAWVQAAVLLIGGLGFEGLALTNLRKLRERRRRGGAAAAFDPLARDTDVVDEPRA